MTGAERARCEALRVAAGALAERPAREIAAALARACARWADPADPDRVAGEIALAGHLAVPRPAVARVLDAAFPAWDPATLLGWVEGELGSVDALDGFAPLAGIRRRAIGGPLTVVLAARGVPTTPVGDLLAGLLVKSAVWLKPASGSDDLAARFAATLKAVDPGLGAAVEVAGWASGSAAGAEVAGRADVVVATGGADTMAALRREEPENARLVLHGPRLSAAGILREALEANRPAAVARLADDVAFAGQAGCLSPVVAWVEAPMDGVVELAAEVAAACAERWPAGPRAGTSAGERAAWAQWVAEAQVEAAAGEGGAMAEATGGSWTVRAVGRPGPPDPPPIPRALVLASVDSAGEIPGLCAARRGRLASVGLAGPAARIGPLAAELAAAGVERICPLGRMQRPPPAWRRDGRPTLADLVRWVDLEGESTPAAPPGGRGRPLDPGRSGATRRR